MLVGFSLSTMSNFINSLHNKEYCRMMKIHSFVIIIILLLTAGNPVRAQENETNNNKSSYINKIEINETYIA